MALKTLFDYYFYVFQLKKRESFLSFIDFGIFVYSWIKSYSDVSFKIIFSLAAIKIVYKIYKFIRKIKKYKVWNQMILRQEKTDFSELLIGEKELKLQFKKLAVPNCGKYENYVTYSDKINAYLREKKNILLSCKEKNKQVKKIISLYQSLLLQFLTFNIWNSFLTNKLFFNEKKLCLSQDIDPSEALVYTHKGDYYDSFLTNEVCNKYLENIEDGKLIADARYFFPVEINNGKKIMKDITTSNMNNHIGASTIAFTKDHYMVFWTQNLKAQTNKDLLMPTGSGSSNIEDLTDNDLLKTVQATMERELFEESSLDSQQKENLCKTKVLGFFRWINRGGKPEFCGISKLNCSIQSLMPNKKEVKVAFDSSHLNKEYVSSVEVLPKIIAKILQRENLSVSLFMSLKFLADYCKKDKNGLKKFLELKSS